MRGQQPPPEGKPQGTNALLLGSIDSRADSSGMPGTSPSRLGTSWRSNDRNQPGGDAASCIHCIPFEELPLPPSERTSNCSAEHLPRIHYRERTPSRNARVSRSAPASHQSREQHCLMKQADPAHDEQTCHSPTEHSTLWKMTRCRSRGLRTYPTPEGFPSCRRRGRWTYSTRNHLIGVSGRSAGHGPPDPWVPDLRPRSRRKRMAANWSSRLCSCCMSSVCCFSSGTSSPSSLPPHSGARRGLRLAGQRDLSRTSREGAARGWGIGLEKRRGGHPPSRWCSPRNRGQRKPGPSLPPTPRLAPSRM